MITSDLLFLTGVITAGTSVILWLSPAVLNRRARINAKFHASVSASNQAVTSAKNQFDLIKRICIAGKDKSGYLRMSVIDRFGNVIFDTDGNTTVTDDAIGFNLQNLFDNAKKEEPVVLKRSLFDLIKNKNSVTVVLFPIFESKQASLMLCAIAKSNRFVSKEHLDLLKEFVSDIEFGTRVFALENYKKTSLSRINVIGRLFDDSEDGIAVTDINGFIIEANQAFCDMNSINPAAIKNKIISEFNNTKKRNLIQSKLSTNSEWVGERILTNPDGKTYLCHVRITTIRHQFSEPQLLVMMVDQSQRLEMKNEVHYLSNHDHLTGLPNKKNFMMQVEDLISAHKDQFTKIAFFYVSINEFNYVSEAVWNRNSDDVIKLLATKIINHLANESIIGRVGNSDFMIVTKIDNHLQAKHIAVQLLQSIKINCTFEDIEVELSPAIGISIHPDNGITVNDLASAAQNAITKLSGNRAKKIKFAAIESNPVNTKDQLKFENDLKKSLKKAELELYYQPQVNLESSAVVGYEALIRWNNPSLGIIYPDSFIGLAEKNGFIIEMGHWVIQQSCKQIEEWKKIKTNKFKIAANISPIQFFDEELVNVIRKSIQDCNILPGELELEITESAIMEDEVHAIRILREIRDLGVLLSIDDFGVGHSSLAYLKKLPVHKVKIDRSFITDLPNNKHSVTIVKAILNIAESLNISVVAEGIENIEQEYFMRSHHCLHGQGSLYGMPVKAEHAIH